MPPAVLSEPSWSHSPRWILLQLLVPAKTQTHFQWLNLNWVIFKSLFACSLYLNNIDLFSGVAPNFKLFVVSLCILSKTQCIHLLPSHTEKHEAVSKKGRKLNVGWEWCWSSHSGTVWSCMRELSHSPPRSPPSSYRRAGPSRGGRGASAWAWNEPGPWP